MTDEALDVRKVKRVEADLDKFIEDRAKEAKAKRAAEAAWAESVRRYHEKRNLTFTWGWVEHHQRLARNHQALADENRARAEHLLTIIHEKEASM